MPENSPDPCNLDARLAMLREPSSDPGCMYYAITLTADDSLKVIFATQTQWVGWSDDKMRHELRRARLVHRGFVTIWERLGQRYAYIHTTEEMVLFLLGGGNALVEKELAETTFPFLLAPDVSIPSGIVGFKSPEMFPETAFRRAPTPKLRMRVLDRDGRRGRICGRRPDDHLDLELHVHHIRPWSKGGLTDLSNLITLCSTCHAGLDPHDDHTLFEKARSDSDDFSKSVANYRKVGFFSSAF